MHDFVEEKPLCHRLRSLVMTENHLLVDGRYWEERSVLYSTLCDVPGYRFITWCNHADTVDLSNWRNCRNVKISRAWRQKKDCETILGWRDWLDVVTKCDIVIILSYSITEMLLKTCWNLASRWYNIIAVIICDCDEHLVDREETFLFLRNMLNDSGLVKHHAINYPQTVNRNSLCGIKNDKTSVEKGKFIWFSPELGCIKYI